MLTDYWPVALGVIVVGYLAVSQVQTHSYMPNKLWTIPGLVLLIGIVIAGPNAWSDPARAPLLITSVGIGIASGLLRGAINRVRREESTGSLVIEGSPSDLLIWVATVAAYVAVRVLISGQFGFDNDTALPSLLMFFGFTLVFQRFVWAWKAPNRLVR